MGANDLNEIQLINFTQGEADSIVVKRYQKDSDFHTTVNTYILTTTKSWGLPLDNAVYRLTANKSIKIKSLSMEPDSSKYDLNNITYYWRRQDFTPQTDFEVIIDK